MSKESNQSTNSHWQPSDADLAEMQRRSAELDSGQVRAIPWEQVRNEVRDQLANFEKLPKSDV
jgi:putative addiction module component (TIGR02574 family)